jgi:hypothetical protein
MSDHWGPTEMSLSLQLMVESARRHALVLPLDEARSRLANSLADNVKQQHALQSAVLRICQLQGRVNDLTRELEQLRMAQPDPAAPDNSGPAWFRNLFR